MKNLVFATNNQHKLHEIKLLLKGKFNIQSLQDLNILEEIPETENTLEGNARLKAEFITSKYGIDCFADDTGLEVESLDGRPGVYSARYAGYENDFEANTVKVLAELNGIDNRTARFRTVICLIMNHEKYFFEGIVNGSLTREKKGSLGFGYDPIFVPSGYSLTFAEMPIEQKNSMSHRAIATSKLIDFLLNQKI
ncbi:MAG: non-canonical purine NTP diphosphatase [Bacteroidales bacterium]|nr:non-canonical purine NTP diphosphatase [Bacteroidales bacterium]